MRDISELLKILEINFKDKSLLETALVHRSYLNENRSAKESNERLEFLGDSVLSLLVSTELYSRFKDFPEGKLTSLRSLLVKAKTLGQIASELSLGSFLFMSKGEERGGGRENQSLLADTFEAVLGAIYLDQGLPRVREFLQAKLFPLIPDIEKQADLLDYKSTLQEVIQEKSRISPVYKVIKEEGPDHDKIFTVGVFVENTLLATGTGRSKQQAQQQAAKAALENEKKLS